MRLWMNAMAVIAPCTRRSRKAQGCVSQGDQPAPGSGRWGSGRWGRSAGAGPHRRGGHERDARKALDERGDGVGGDERRGQEEVSELEELHAVLGLEHLRLRVVRGGEGRQCDSVRAGGGEAQNPAAGMCPCSSIGLDPTDIIVG